MRILLGVTGCIGAYKTPDLIRHLRRAGAEVQVILTRGGSWFVTEGVLQTVSGHAVYTDMFAPKTAEGVEHIDVPKNADLLLVAPATAHVLAKLAHGLADDFLSTAFLAYDGPVLLAPAMNTTMYRHAAVQRNLEILAARGVQLIGPDEGELACGDEGEGRLSDPEAIAAAAVSMARRADAGDLAGCRVVVTSGPTHEPLDPVRFLSNPSTGRMGHALARAAAGHGATVTLITGPTELPDPCGVEVVRVKTARGMRDAVLARADDADAVLMAAAVGDYEAELPAAQKIKKTAAELTLRLRRTPDVLAELGGRRGTAVRPILVGFAAETQDEIAAARAKLESKGADYMVANRVDEPDSGFGVSTNRVVLLTRDGDPEAWPLLAKSEVAERLIRRLVRDGMAAGRRPAPSDASCPA